MKRTTTMLAIVLMLLCASSWASAQMFKEDFNYTAGDSVTKYGWLVSSGGTTNAILIAAPGLAFTGYPGSGIGNAARLTTTGQDVYGTITPDSIGNVYASFLMKVDSAKTGDYFFSIAKTGSMSSMYARTYVKASGAGFVVGVSKNNEAQTYGTTVYSYGTTYLVVVKYAFIAGTTNDLVSVYVFPATASFATEPATPEAGPHNGSTVGDLTSAGHVVLRQGSTSSAPALMIDGIRIDSTWDGVMKAPPALPVYSIGTANVPDEIGHFTSLKAACDSINAMSGAGITADMTFYITSDLTDSTNTALAPNTNGHTITFKPYVGVKPTITFKKVTDNTGLSGGWVIGAKNLTTTSATNYGITLTDSTERIVIDGSNTVNGTTRDLTIATAAGTHANTNPIKIFGNCNNITVKNLNVTTGQSVSYAIVIVNRNSTVAPAGNYVPDYITIDNCNVTNTFGAAGQGIAVSNSGTPTAFPKGIVIKNNIVTATTRGIFLNYTGDTDVFGNQISINQTASGSLSEGIFAFSIGSPTNVVNIYNNKISKLSTANTTTGAYGIYGIYIGSNGVYNVYNNMISGFGLPNGFQGIATGIGVVSATVNGLTANVYNNSVFMTGDTATAGAIAPIHAAFYLNLTGASGTRIANVKNNIFATGRTNYASAAMQWADSGLTTLTSDKNVLSTAGGSAIAGKRGTVTAATLGDWKTVSGQDANSVAGAAQFVSATDLHINPTATPASVASNAGIPIAIVTKDIDGEARSLTTPDLGADEFTAIVVTDPSVVTIAEARKDLNNDRIADRSLTKDTLTVYGVINGPNYNLVQTSYFMQDATGGINIFSFSPMTETFAAGDSVMVKGYVAQFRGLVELTLLDATSASFKLIKKVTAPTPKRITTAQFVANPDAWEAQLIEIDTLYKLSGTWPTSSYSSVYVTGPTKKDTIQLFLDNDTDIDGSPEPEYPLNVTGVVSQYTSSSSVYNNGYELMPRGLYDIKPIKVTGVNDIVSGLPKTFELMNNYPNPFNPTTTIKFALPQTSAAKLVIYDMLGREVRTLVNGQLNAGYFETSWNGKNNAGMQAASGMYIYRMEAGSFVSAKKMMLLK